MQKIAQQMRSARPAGPACGRGCSTSISCWRRPMTLGVRGVVHDRGDKFRLPDPPHLCAGLAVSGRRRRASARRLVEALERELQEEGNITLTAPPVLKSMHFNRRASSRDHVAPLSDRGLRARPRRSCRDREIAEAGFFPLDRLPDQTTPATLRRIAEIFSGERARPTGELQAAIAGDVCFRPEPPAIMRARNSRSPARRARCRSD